MELETHPADTLVFVRSFDAMSASPSSDGYPYLDTVPATALFSGEAYYARLEFDQPSRTWIERFVLGSPCGSAVEPKYSHVQQYPPLHRSVTKRAEFDEKGDAVANVPGDDAQRAPSRFETERIEQNQPKLNLSGTLARRICANVRVVLWLFGEKAKIADWLAEQGGLETSVSRETFAKENPREYWKNFASKSLSILQRMSSPSVRHEFRRSL
jgi:hypothetical protein